MAPSLGASRVSARQRNGGNGPSPRRTDGFAIARPSGAKERASNPSERPDSSTQLRDELAEALARWEEDVEEFELEFMVEENMRRATAVVNGEFYDEAAGERRFRAAAPPRPHLRTLWSALDLEQCHAAGRAIADACFISRAGGRRSSPGSPEAFRRRARAA